MLINVLNTKPTVGNDSVVFFLDFENPNYPENLTAGNIAYIERQILLEKNIIEVHQNNSCILLVKKKEETSLEPYRKLGNDLSQITQKEKLGVISIDGHSLQPNEILAFAEGLALSGYRFLNYFKPESRNKKIFSVTQIDLFHPDLIEKDAENLNNLIKAAFWVRDMVNEPVSVMNAIRFSKEVVLKGQESGFNVEVLHKMQIESLRMGGLLAVNRGSIDPPTFTICEYKPSQAANQKPIVLVGKGVMYDTGGLSLKPTLNSMDEMKCDMAGAAAVAGTLYSLALQKIPVWVIGLMPATDNRPDGNAYTPGDVITMYNGLHVEVMNTDAEGRLILADALTYADQYEPELVIDLATLTGSAQMAIGKEASVMMGNASDAWFQKLEEAGTAVHERLVRFPFWDEYKEALKSPIADLKNIGKREAGAISAGKFLEHFTKSPYIHIDIAGTAFLTADDSYRLQGGTGIGVRLLTEFFKKISNTQQNH